MARSLGEPVRLADETQGTTNWIPNLLTLALVVPSGAVAVTFLLEIDILANRESRRVIAAGAALIVPIALFGLRGIQSLFREPGRALSVFAGLVWMLVAVVLVAIPLSARLGLGSRSDGSTLGRTVRDLRLPDSTEIVVAIVAGITVAAPFVLLGLAVARSPTGIIFMAASLAVGVGLATVPIAFYGIAMSYDLPVGLGDDRLVDTAQSMAIVWLVPAPMAALIAGLAIGHAVSGHSRRAQ